MDELATLRFLATGENVVFPGPTDVDKSLRSVSLALAAVQAGHSAYFPSAAELLARLRQTY